MSFDLRITYLEPPEGWMYKSFNDVVWWGHQTFSFSSEEKVIPCEKFECKIHCGRIFVFVLVQIFKCFLLHSITIEQFVTRHSTLCKVPLNHPLSPCWNTKTLYFVNNRVWIFIIWGFLPSGKMFPLCCTNYSAGAGKCAELLMVGGFKKQTKSKK